MINADNITIIIDKSQSPQIGSMFLTTGECWQSFRFRLVAIPSNRVNVSYLSFSQIGYILKIHKVAIPSNRVNVSYLRQGKGKEERKMLVGRNPLKSGQCFLQRLLARFYSSRLEKSRNPLKSGQCFLH